MKTRRGVAVYSSPRHNIKRYKGRKLMQSDYVIKNGKSQYKIVIPKNNSVLINFAAEELVYFLEKATGCKMSVAQEEGSDCTIKLCVQGGGNEGFRIFSENGNYTVSGYSEKGVVFGVYALLRKLIGLTFFTPDDYVYDAGDVPFTEFDEERVPDIPLRAIGIAPLHSEKVDGGINKNALRMGVSSMGDGWGIIGHSYFKILPPEIYKEKHPDWYFAGDNGVNLCLTNEEMRKEFVERVKALVLSHPKDKFFMLGQPDTPTYCRCEKCLEKLKKCGGYASTIMLEFTNSVVKDINAWLKSRGDDRDIIFVMFVYQKTMTPPVKKVAGEYKPSFDFKLEKNLSVMLAPLGARGDLSYFDKNNHVSMNTCYYDGTALNSRELFLGWRAVVDTLCVWSYCNDFSDLFVPFNCWDVLEKNYRGFKKHGVEYVFEEGPYLKYVPNFTHLRTFAVSKLMWDSSYSLKKAIDEFFVGYYGKNSAAPLKKYFNYLRGHLKAISKKQRRPMLYVRYDDFSDLGMPEYWSFESLIKAKNMHEKAVKAADEAHFERVEEEGLPVWLILLLRYNRRLGDEERSNLANKVLRVFEKYGYDGEEEGVCGKYIKKVKTCV